MTMSVVERVASAYRRGRLVPFIGGGMSAGVCRLWDPFVDALERQAGLQPTGSRDPTERAARAVWALRVGQGEDLAAVVKTALPSRPGPARAPPQTEALARLMWPVVVSTNYDDLYVAAAHAAHLQRNPRLRAREDRHDVPLILLGRSATDCQRVLTSLRQPDLCILWAVQGYAGGQAACQLDNDRAVEGDRQYEAVVRDPGYRAQAQALESQLVVGHAEYRRVALASRPFRRAFAELHRSRSLFFLGSGLREHYFQDLFGEIIELYGPSPEPHFAILRRGEVDPDFLRQYFGIWVHEIAENDEIVDVLDGLDAPTPDRPRPSLWRFSAPREADAGSSSLTVVRRSLSNLPPPDECIVFSAGGTEALKLSRVGKRTLTRHGLTASPDAFSRITGTERTFSVWQHVQRPTILAVDARTDPWSEDGARLRPTNPAMHPIGPTMPSKAASSRQRRDIRIVPCAVEALMDVVQTHGFRHAHSMLLSAGPLRTFPPSQTALQMVRGWARWSAAATPPAPDLSLYVVLPTILQDLDSGRLDLQSGLDPDVVDFWLDVVTRDEDEHRFRVVERVTSSLRAMLADRHVRHPDWALTLTPAPSLDWDGWTLRGVDAWERSVGGDLSLETFGILPGSTLRVTEPSPENVPREAATMPRSRRGP